MVRGFLGASLSRWPEALLAVYGGRSRESGNMQVKRSSRRRLEEDEVGFDGGCVGWLGWAGGVGWLVCLLAWVDLYRIVFVGDRRQ